MDRSTYEVFNVRRASPLTVPHLDTSPTTRKHIIYPTSTPSHSKTSFYRPISPVYFCTPFINPNNTHTHSPTHHAPCNHQLPPDPTPPHPQRPHCRRRQRPPRGNNNSRRRLCLIGTKPNMSTARQDLLDARLSLASSRTHTASTTHRDAKRRDSESFPFIANLDDATPLNSGLGFLPPSQRTSTT